MLVENTGNDGNQRSTQDRRAEQERRKNNDDPSENERRLKGQDDRRSWVGRRQTAEWRKQS